MVRRQEPNLCLQLLSRYCHVVDPTHREFAKSRAYACWKIASLGQQRLEHHDYWLRLLVAYSALTGEMKVGIPAISKALR